ncbi:MAG: YitT family protein [Ruminiclostridium sp.]|nr:YitT family protein [Ruminiclostridium sp.]
MKAVKEFLLINSGLFLVALGIFLFKAPNNFVTGGVSGLAIITGHFVQGISIGPIMLVINIFLLFAGFIFIGPTFGWKTVYSSFALSGMVWVLEKLVAIHGSLTGDLFLELIYSIIMPAVGTAVVFNHDASTGGTDIIAKIINKYTHFHIGKTLLMADAVIVGMSIFVFGIKIGMYSILGLALKGFLIDTVIEGINIRKQMTIITTHTAEIKEYIIKELKRGATITRAVGAFTNEDRYVITTVVSRGQAIKLRRYVREIDNMAFITINNTSEIIGKGFRYLDI